MIKFLLINTAALAIMGNLVSAESAEIVTAAWIAGAVVWIVDRCLLENVKITIEFKERKSWKEKEDCGRCSHFEGTPENRLVRLH